MPPAYDISHYKVGIICALPLERKAVEAMLDEIHNTQIHIPGDDNVYTFGSLEKPGTVKHNVVVASLGAGSYGVVSAAQVANDIRRSFPHLKYGLMVGIAGAMARPKEADIRLGDIIVGCADNLPSVIDYSRGKDTADGFDIRSELANPPGALAIAVGALEAAHGRLGPTYLIHLADMLQRYRERYDQPRWPQNYYNLPDADDILFDSKLDSCEGQDDCGACLKEGRTQVIRKHRDLISPPPDLASRELKFIRKGPNGTVDYPMVFRGSIGSAHRLMKSSKRRDEEFQRVKDQRKAELLCFEMEASGIVRGWPCLVIRGICDYADSHKNNAWQNFAAATAAAYAKDLLLCVSSDAVRDANPIGEVVLYAGQTPSNPMHRGGFGPLFSSSATYHTQTDSQRRLTDNRSALPALDAGAQRELNRQFINAAGAGNLDLVTRLHRQGADINSSDGPQWTPTAIAWATGGYKVICNTIDRFPNSPIPTAELKKYTEVIRYLSANGLDDRSLQPETRLLIRQAAVEDRY